MHNADRIIFRNVENYISLKFPHMIERLLKVREARLNFFFEQEESRLLSQSPPKQMFRSDHIVKISKFLLILRY